MSLPALRPVVAGTARAGKSVMDTFVTIGMHATLYVRALLTVPVVLLRYWRHVYRHVADISFGSASLLAGGGTVGVIFAMSAVASTQIGLEGYRGLGLIGLSPMTGLMSALLNTREIAPVVASIALAAKVGTGFTAQLGAMRISDEIDALDVMAVPSLRFLVSTRLAAAIIAITPLYLVGLFASYIATKVAVVRIKGLSPGTYEYYFDIGLAPADVLDSLLKALVFAVVVTLVHCGYGFYASGGPEGVGRAAGRALRTSIVAVAVVDVVLTTAFWGLHPSIPGLGP